MGRRNRYATHVEPYLEDITEWIQLMDEYQIAGQLGIAVSTFEKYKNEHPELCDALKDGKEKLTVQLKTTLKQKALGFKYTERKITLRNVDGKQVKVVEEFERYAVPDLGSIHLLLKNLDDSWHNDDVETIKQKQKALEQTDKKIERSEWS